MECRICLSPKTKIKFNVNHFKPSFKIYECMECGFQFQDIDYKDAYRFYEEGYYTGSSSFNYQDERKMEEASRIVWKARIKKLLQVSHSGNYLDIGCSFGGLMQTANEAGFEVYGAEVSNFSGEYSEKRFGNNKIFIGNIENMELPKDYFSAITMIEVIEHLFDPIKALLNIYESMKSGGILLIQTADMGGLQAKWGKERYHYYLPGHLSYFTRKNLTEVLKKIGFSRVKFFGGVEFGLLPKLQKSCCGFQQLTDYLKWIKISFYHFASKISFGSFHFTSSMVLYIWK